MQFSDRFKYIFVLNTIMFFFIGCVSTNMTSEKIREFDGEINKIFIIVKVMPNLEGFAKTIKKRLPTSLKQHNVKARAVYDFPKRGDSIVYKDMIKKYAIDIRAYRPDAILIIKQNFQVTTTKSGISHDPNTGATHNYSFNSSSFDFTAHMISTKIDKIIWRADTKVKNRVGESAGSTVAWSFTSNLVEALQKDRLIK